MFEKLDPRVVLAWWLALSIMAFQVSTNSLSALLLLMLTVWILSGKGKTLLNFTKIVFPFIVFVGLLKGGDWNAAMLAVQRMFILLGSSAFAISMGPDRFLIALRNIRSERLPAVDGFLGIVFSLLSQGLLTIPITAQEIGRLQEIQRSRGIDTKSINPFKKAKTGAALAIPLFQRFFTRFGQASLMSEILGDSSLEKRTLFNQLTLKRQDWLVLALIVFTTIVFSFKV